MNRSAMKVWKIREEIYGEMERETYRADATRRILSGGKAVEHEWGKQNLSWGYF